jgi:hypothetical protein
VLLITVCHYWVCRNLLKNLYSHNRLAVLAIYGCKLPTQLVCDELNNHLPYTPFAIHNPCALVFNSLQVLELQNLAYHWLNLAFLYPLLDPLQVVPVTFHQHTIELDLRPADPPSRDSIEKIKDLLNDEWDFRTDVFQIATRRGRAGTCHYHATSF